MKNRVNALNAVRNLNNDFIDNNNPYCSRNTGFMAYQDDKTI